MDKAVEKSIAVLGLGKFGRSLVTNLYRLGADVLAVDSDEKIVAEITPKSTSAICADLTNEEEVLSLGLEHMDVVVTAMGNNLTASIMAISVAKEKGVPVVAAKTTSDRMAAILRKVGADAVIDPEEEGGSRSAHILMSRYLSDCYKLDENMVMMEMVPKEEWIGKSLNELDLRKNMNLNVVAMRKKEGLWRFIDPQVPLTDEYFLLIVMERATMDKLSKR